MRLRLFTVNILILAGTAWVSAFGSEIYPKNLLPPVASATTAPTELTELESRAALEPSVASITALAAAYLDRDQPGLASAVIERSPSEIRDNVRVAELHARALFHRGRTSEALARIQGALAACDADESRCRPWQIARASRQIAFLQEVVAAGIEDPTTNPAAVRAAYARSTREVGLVAMR
jgi:hypothetical protein